MTTTAANFFLSELYREKLKELPRYQDPLRLLQFGYRVYSQNDEDGVIHEIFRRIGMVTKTFIEFGVEPPECNSLALLAEGWRGLWMDGKDLNLEAYNHHFNKGQLATIKSFITKESINVLLAEGFEKIFNSTDVDLLSVDLDGNDYWVWEAITAVNPRVVVVEYNATFPPPISRTIKYNPVHTWKSTSYFGASLKALEILGRKKGFCLVGCNMAGVNAFFVRQDLVKNLFCEPFTAENHYEPPRYFLQPYAGHKPGYGEFVDI